ncbi:MAG: exo-alpha-sialidase [Dermatophilaceae bacterium]|nr:exo-alpha-sialidase [Dermatophilaceae bacterium]
MRHIRRALIVSVLISAPLAATAIAAPAGAGSALRFDKPVLLTPQSGFGGFEPSLIVDQQDNVWATAHRTYTPLSPDPGAAGGVRGASWLWMSKDGKTFTNPPGLTPTGEYQKNFGLEGDVARDGAGHVYFIDLGPAEARFTAWKVDGPGQATALRTTPALPVVLDDRPFVAAGGNGTVFVAVNNSAATRARGGQYAFYVSRDGGATFGQGLPYTAAGSSFCRPHVSPRNPRLLTAVCTGETPSPSVARQSLLAFTSTDAGASWTRTVIRNDAGDSPGGFEIFPSLAEAPDGTLSVLHHQQQYDPADTGRSGPMIGSKLMTYSTRDGGLSWSKPRDVTPEPGIWSQTSLSAAPNGLLGLAGYYRPDTASPWTFRAATFRTSTRDIRSVPVAPGQVASLSSELNPPGEFTQAAFDSRSKFKVIYAARELALPVLTGVENAKFGNTQVFYAQQP